MSLMPSFDGRSTDTWHTVGAVGQPAFQGTWSAAATVQFVRDSAGNVHLRGQGTGGGAAEIFILPAGYRPTGQTWVQPATTNTGTAQVEITTAGQVRCVTKSGSPTIFGVYTIFSVS